MKKLFLLLSDISTRLRKYILVLIISSTAIPFLELFGITLLIPILSKYTNSNELNNIPYLNVITEKLSFNQLLAAFLIIFVIKSLYIVTHNYFNIYLNNSILNQLSLKYFQRYNSQPIDFHNKHQPSDLLKRIRTDLAYINIYLSSWINIFTDLILVFTLGFYLIILNAEVFFIISFILITFTIIFYLIFFKKNKIYSNKRNLGDKNIQKIILENFSGIKNLKLFNKENIFVEKLRFYLNEQKIYNSFTMTIGNSTKIYLEFIFVITIISVLFYLRNTDQEILIYLSILLLISIRLLPIFSRIQASIQNIGFYKNAIDSLGLDIKNNLAEYEIITPHSIEGIDIKFNYQNNNIFNNFNFKIQKDKLITFIVGESGSGKSTLFEIITGLRKISGGSILINGVRLNNRNFKLDKIAFLSQVPYVFEGSLIDNITFGRKYDYKLLIDSLKQVEALKFVNLKNLESYYINENGSNFSLGQLQRITLARALYGSPEIIFLDEPTSSLDNFNENNIINNLIKISKTTKLIVITHSTEIIKSVKNKHIIQL